MPALAETIGQNLSNYEPVEKSQRQEISLPSPNREPGYNVFLRCPLPPIWQTTPDSLRQYYQNNLVPQTRLFNPQAIIPSGGNTTIVRSLSSSASSGGSSTSTTLAISSTSVKTSAILAGSKFSGSFTLSKAFELLSVSATSPCRIQLYGTSLAQLADASRPLDVSPPAGTSQNIICDVVLDTAPLLWSFQNREGANADNPVSSTIYLTVTNLDAITDVVTLTFSYIPIVS